MTGTPEAIALSNALALTGWPNFRIVGHTEVILGSAWDGHPDVTYSRVTEAEAALKFR